MAAMSRDLLIQLAGLHAFAFALFHIGFWKLFRWNHQLAKVGLITRAVTQILNLRLIYVFLGMGALCFLFTRELHTTPLGRALLVFMSLFWLGRTVEQFVFLRINRPMLHVLTALFVIGAILFALPLLQL
jgi:hypothetical protein